MHQSKEELEQELKIIEKAKRQPEAFGVLYEKYYKSIFVFVLKRVDSKDTAGDITAQVFLKALDNLEKYQFRGVPFSAWLFRIASNQVSEFYRKTEKKRTVTLENEYISNIMDEADNTDIKGDGMELLVNLINQLREEEVQLIEMRFFEQLSIKDVGFILNLSESNIKVKTHRILKKLKKLALSKF